MDSHRTMHKSYPFGGFNPVEKYESVADPLNTTWLQMQKEST